MLHFRRLQLATPSLCLWGCYKLTKRKLAKQNDQEQVLDLRLQRRGDDREDGAMDMAWHGQKGHALERSENMAWQGMRHRSKLWSHVLLRIATAFGHTLTSTMMEASWKLQRVLLPCRKPCLVNYCAGRDGPTTTTMVSIMPAFRWGIIKYK